MSRDRSASQESISLLKVEMVVLEINFGKGRKDDILVYFGDNPRDLAEQFVIKHSLKDSAGAAICATLEQTIADFKREIAQAIEQQLRMQQNLFYQKVFVLPDKSAGAAVKNSAKRKTGAIAFDECSGRPNLFVRSGQLPQIIAFDNRRTELGQRAFGKRVNMHPRDFR